MSEEEFLKRWSRRKQEARAEPPPAETVVTQVDVPGEPEIDLSKLPSLDSIGAATDITDFLR